MKDKEVPSEWARFKPDHADYQEKRYDSSKVTNKFGVGEQIEWFEEGFMGYDDSLTSVYETGIIKKITPYTLILEINGRDCRIDKTTFIYEHVKDIGLYEAIKASIGQDPSPKKAKSNIPHDAYRLRDPRDKAIFYVGISKNVRRRYKQHLACSGLNFQLNIRIQEILQCGLTPEMEIIEKNIDGAEKARERERYWIRHHQSLGDVLTNIAEMDEVE